ncbi:MAG TPA: AmmeMemoRadiSam system protein A [Armatimonadota bacterium]|nr:AmmeMemoRadiSam system protein A [Armatimonadota bacterium]
MPVLGAFIVPHPPIILPEIGRGEEKKIQKTIDSYREVARRVKNLKPETIVLTSPHSVMYADYIHISPGEKATGDMRQLRAPQVTVTAFYDTAFVREISQLSEAAGIAAGTLGERNPTLDHGTMLPLLFINEQFTDYKLVRTGLSGLTPADHYRFGMCIAEAANKTGKRVVIVASGDLSHKTRADGPYGYAEEGVQFDREITAAMASGDFLKFLAFSPEFAEKAAECGLRSCIIMAGAFDGIDVDAELLSYEGTFGVGYGIASFLPKGLNPERHLLETYFRQEKDRLQKIKETEDEYVRLARNSVEHFITTGRRLPLPDGLPDDMFLTKAGVFVSLKKFGNLRGCIGTISPVTGSVAEEILRNAVSSCSEDPRFDKVRPDELSDLIYSVDVLSPPEPITSETALDVRRYGVIVSAGHKRGLLLPNLEGVDTIEQQVSITRQKAGIRPGEKVSLERFEVVRHT